LTVPATFVTEKFVFCIQGLSRAEVLEAAGDGAILLYIQAQVEECLIPGCHCLTPQTPSLIRQYTLHAPFIQENDFLGYCTFVY
jgi:hypothetical protein